MTKEELAEFSRIKKEIEGKIGEYIKEYFGGRVYINEWDYDEKSDSFEITVREIWSDGTNNYEDLSVPASELLQ